MAKPNGRFREQPKDKLQGGYYTPSDIAAWLSRWAIRSRSDRVLEPSSGEGVFLAAVALRLLELGAKPQDALKQISAINEELVSVRFLKKRSWPDTRIN
jgi:adenine-specific DNA-methyltransferase